MAEARSRQLWDHTSELLAVLANGLLGKKITGSQLHPFERRRRVERLPGDDGKDGWIVVKRAFKGKTRVIKAADVKVARS